MTITERMVKAACAALEEEGWLDPDWEAEDNIYADPGGTYTREIVRGFLEAAEQAEAPRGEGGAA